MDYPYASELFDAYYAAPGTVRDKFIGVARHVLENAALWSERLGIPLPAPDPVPDFAPPVEDGAIPGCDCGCNGEALDDLGGEPDPDLYDIHEVVALIGEAFAAFDRA